jgi:hypothetical protein
MSLSRLPRFSRNSRVLGFSRFFIGRKNYPQQKSLTLDILLEKGKIAMASDQGGG